MSSTAGAPTPFPYVNSVLGLLLANLRDTLGDYFVGLYLHGSLAGGDFDPGHSDIDFLVVTTEELPEKMLKQPSGKLASQSIKTLSRMMNGRLR